MLLPVGISFYTFKSISYLIDVYRSGHAGVHFSGLAHICVVSADRFGTELCDMVRWNRRSSSASGRRQGQKTG